MPTAETAERGPALRINWHDQATPQGPLREFQRTLPAAAAAALAALGPSASHSKLSKRGCNRWNSIWLTELYIDLDSLCLKLSDAMMGCQTMRISKANEQKVAIVAIVLKKFQAD